MVAGARMARAAVRMRVLHGAEEVEGSGRRRGRQTDGENHGGQAGWSGSSIELQLCILIKAEPIPAWDEQCTTYY